MQSQGSRNLAAGVAPGLRGLGWTRLLVLAAAGFGAVFSAATAQARDDHRSAPRSSAPRGNERQSRPAVGRPQFRSQPQPQYRAQPGAQPRGNVRTPNGQQMPQYRTAPPAGYPYGNRPQVAAPVIPQSRPQYSAPGYGTPGYGSQNRAPYAAPQATPRYGNPQGYNSPQNNRQYSQGRASEAPGQQHLGDWMQRRQALSPQEKERALQNEPGFNRLAPQQQQRLVQRLRDLDAMRPTERERTLARVENMERLSPQQKEQVRGAATQFQQMSPDRQRVVRRAFQDLRNVPPGLRGSELYGPRYSGQFSPQERSVLGNLLSVEPYQPAPLPPR